MLKACSKCGKIHDKYFNCGAGALPKTQEQKLRNKSKWHKKSEDIRNRSFNLCAICRELGEINYKNIEVHHIIKLREDPNLLLEDSNLISLCSFHHKLADKGAYSSEYLKELANKRDELI